MKRQFSRRKLTFADGEYILWHILDYYLEIADGQIPINEIQIYLAAQRDVKRCIDEIRLIP